MAATEGIPGEAEVLLSLTDLSATAFDYLKALSPEEWAAVKKKVEGLRGRGGWLWLRDQIQAGDGWEERIKNAFRAVPFFSGLLKGEYSAEVDSMARHLEVRQFAVGEPIVLVGDQVDGLYMLLDGARPATHQLAIVTHHRHLPRIAHYCLYWPQWGITTALALPRGRFAGKAVVEVMQEGSDEPRVVHTYESGGSFGEQAMIDAHKNPGVPALRNATIRASGCGKAGTPPDMDLTTCLRLGMAHFQKLPAKAVEIGSMMAKMAVKQRDKQQAGGGAAAVKRTKSADLPQKKQERGPSETRKKLTTKLGKLAAQEWFDLTEHLETDKEWGTIKRSLAQVPAFTSLADEILFAVARHLEVRLYASGENIVSEGDDADGLYLIYSGAADVLKGEDKVHAYGESLCRVDQSDVILNSCL